MKEEKLTFKQILGLLILASPFIAILVYYIMTLGIIDTLRIIGLLLSIFVVVGIGLGLVNGDL